MGLFRVEIENTTDDIDLQQTLFQMMKIALVATEIYDLYNDLNKIKESVQSRTFFIYKGGDHISIHKEDGKERLILITRKWAKFYKNNWQSKPINFVFLGFLLYLS